MRGCYLSSSVCVSSSSCLPCSALPCSVLDPAYMGQAPAYCLYTAAVTGVVRLRPVLIASVQMSVCEGPLAPHMCVEYWSIGPDLLFIAAAAGSCWGVTSYHLRCSQCYVCGIVKIVCLQWCLVLPLLCTPRLQVVEVVRACVRVDPTQRPPMAEVVKLLKARMHDSIVQTTANSTQPACCNARWADRGLMSQRGMHVQATAGRVSVCGMLLHHTTWQGLCTQQQFVHCATKRGGQCTLFQLQCQQRTCAAAYMQASQVELHWAT